MMINRKSVASEWFSKLAVAAGLLFVGTGMSGLTVASAAEYDGPVSEYLDVLEGREDPAFCADWNPEYAHRGHRCCYKVKPRKQKRCAPERRGVNYCNDMTEEMRQYYDDASSGKLGDLLDVVSREIGNRGQQAYCDVNFGFLAYGRPMVPTSFNRIQLKSPDRCVYFGTDHMIAMLEWVGHKLAEQYPGTDGPVVKMQLGDISAPRGGCLWGRSGRRGHSSHTSGQDVDIGFLNVKDGRYSNVFSKTFDPKPNWWLVKQFFKNPYACVKVIFLDRKLIAKLAKVAGDDPDWLKYRRFIRHVKLHRNHYHIRIGDHPGEPGCEPGANPELETVEELDGEEDEMKDEYFEFVSMSAQAAVTKPSGKVVAGAPSRDSREAPSKNPPASASAKK